MDLLYSSILVAALVLFASLVGAAESGRILIGVAIPYAAFALFLVGVCWRVAGWSRSPVPFRIPTTCGQQRSLPWIRSARLDNPSTGIGAVGRMALEVLLFSIGDCMNNAPEQVRAMYDLEVVEWSKRLDYALLQLAQRVTYHDGEDGDVTAEAA